MTGMKASGWTRILADEPLLRRLCTDHGGIPSEGDARDLEHPLLVYAHSRYLGWAGGLATLERMLAQTESPHCRVAILGFLPLGRYRELEYLVNHFNYRRLPSAELPSPESDHCLVKEKARRQARRNRTSSEHRRVSHDIRGLLLDEKLSTRCAVRNLLDTRTAVIVPEMRDFLDNLLDRLRSAQPSGIRAILSDCYTTLQTLRGKQ
jgi:hypothetical protein